MSQLLETRPSDIGIQERSASVAEPSFWPRGAVKMYAQGPIPGVVTPTKRAVRSYAVWTLRRDKHELPPDWRPRDELSTPPAFLKQFPECMVRPFVVAFNATEYSRRKGQWAALLRGSGFLILRLDGTDHPSDPDMLPPCALTGLTRKEAEDTVRLANELILKTAGVPGIWHVVLVDPHSDDC